MLPIIRLVIYILVLPIIYLVIILFSLNLVRRVGSQVQRVRMLFSVIAGMLISVMIVVLDQTYGLIKNVELPDPAKISELWPYVAGAFLLGLLLIFGARLALKPQQVLSFIVMFAILAVIVSVYSLLTLSETSSVVVMCSLSFFLGVTICLMLIPGIFRSNL